MQARLALATLIALASAGAAEFQDTYPDEAYHEATYQTSQAEAVTVERHFALQEAHEVYVWFDDWATQSVAEGFQVSYHLAAEDGTLLLEDGDAGHDTEPSATAQAQAGTLYVFRFTVTPPTPAPVATHRFVGVLAIQQQQEGDGSGGTLDPSIGTRLDYTITPDPEEPGDPDDPDADGCSTQTELEIGTDPYDPDTDNDGIPDCEDPCPLDPHNQQPEPSPPPEPPPPPGDADDGDSDGDGCSDEAEAAMGTDPDRVDTDGDGFSDCEEARLGSDPLDADDVPEDSDEDGLPDWWERDTFGSLAETGDGDRDGDGFTNLQEYRLGSDATDRRSTPVDRDGDGMPDECERQHFGNLRQGPEADADADGFSNRVECLNESSPVDADSVPFDIEQVTDADGDGLPDWWEQQFLGGLDHGPHGDPDGDGCTNACEYAAGTHPLAHDGKDQPAKTALPWWLIAVAAACAGVALVALWIAYRRRRAETAEEPPHRGDGPFLLRSDPYGDP